MCLSCITCMLHAKSFLPSPSVQHSFVTVSPTVIQCAHKSYKMAITFTSVVNNVQQRYNIQRTTLHSATTPYKRSVMMLQCKGHDS